MRILNAEQIRKVEETANELGMDFLRLMENAGSACARYIITEGHKAPASDRGLIKNGDGILPSEKESKITVVCGKGKNGGDGFVIARKLYENGFDVSVVLASGVPASADALEMYVRVTKLPIKVYRFDREYADAADRINESDLIVDCLFGIGFHGQPNAEMADMFARINKSSAKVVSIDVPSGVNTDTGEVEGICVKADVTISISTLKPAHVIYPSAYYCGKTAVVTIGIPEDCYDYVESKYFTLDKADIKRMFIPRDPVSNKGDFGHVLSICGCKNMPGAAVLASTAAVKCGAGLVTAAFPEAAYSAVSSHTVEQLLLPLESNKKGTLSKAALPGILKAMQKATVMVIGCGLGLNEDTEFIVSEVIKSAQIPIILDADGINAVSGNIDILKAARVPLILTPHPGEMSRLINRSTAYIQNNRLSVAEEFSKEYGVTLVLKGASTLVSSSAAQGIYINRTGNAGMAKGGCGDMLSGMIAAFIAQGVTVSDAAFSAVYIHGYVGDRVSERLSKCGMTPTDMLNALPLLLSEFE